MKHHAHLLKVYFFASIFISLSACDSDHALKVAEKSAIIGLATPFQLPMDSGQIYLQDYIDDLSELDSVGKVSGLQLTLSPNKENLKVIVDTAKLKPISELILWVKGIPYSIILKRSIKQNVQLKFLPTSKNIKEVALAGDFNGWQPTNTKMDFGNGVWSINLVLNPGRYNYKVVVDGVWITDPGNSDSTSNGNGGFNSVLKVEQGSAADPILYTINSARNSVTIGAENAVKELFVLWENYRLPATFLKKEGLNTTITLPDEASKKDRSTLRIWGYNEHGVANDLLIPLVKNKVVTDPTELKRDDFHAAIFYFMMVDRFKDGNTKNNAPLNDPRVDVKADYQGGDLEGITKKIEDGYFKNLGINTLWVSPIVQNPTTAYQEYPEPRRWFSGYHGYWPVYETKVDSRFGNDKVLTQLVETAHKNNMNVIMDFVANHIHKENPVYKQHPDWFSSMYLPDGKVNIRIWDEQRLTTWFDDFMPDIDYTKPAAINYFSDSAIYWLKKFDLDGFRHDATKHVSEDFWRVLTRKVKHVSQKEKDRKIYQIGETFGSNELISSYIGSGMMDAQFNFNQYFAARPVFASNSESFENVADAMEESKLNFGSHHLMGNITGNHDMPRFIYYAGGSAIPGENAKEAGWTRDIKVEDPKGYDRLKMLNAWLLTTAGVPIIYYGDEIGMPGADDPDNRRMMRFDNISKEEESVKTTTAALTKLRSGHLALTYGDTRILQSDKDHLIYMRQYFDKIAIIAFNRSEVAANLEVTLPPYISGKNLKANFGNTFLLNGSVLKIKVKPLSFEVFTN